MKEHKFMLEIGFANGILSLIAFTAACFTGRWYILWIAFVIEFLLELYKQSNKKNKENS